MDKKKRLKRFQTDLGKIRNRAQSFSSGAFWNPKAGVNRIRVLPPWNDQGIFYKEIVWHYGFNVDGQNRAYPCLRSLGQSKCPACQLVARYADEKEDEIKSIVQRMRPKGKWFMNIIDRKNEDEEVRIYGAAFTVAKQILSYFADEDYGDITDPEEGRDLIVEREGTGFTTKYSVRPGAKPTPIGVENWEEKLHDLDTETIREELSGPQMLELLESLFGETLDLTGITTDKPKKKKVTEEDEEEEVVKKPKKKVEEDDDDEEETPVTKKNPKKPVAPKAEAEEEDDNDLGDDEDED